MAELTLRDIQVFNATLNLLSTELASKVQWDYTRPELLELINAHRVETSALEKLNEAIKDIPANDSPLVQWLKSGELQAPFNVSLNTTGKDNQS